jgi:uncharacterized protein (TIGR02588 family)
MKRMNEQTAKLSVTNNPNITKQSSRPGTINHTPLLEWLVGAVGLILVSGVILFLLYQGFADQNLPPQIHLTVQSMQSAGNQYLVLVKASNQGNKTVKGLVVEGRVEVTQAESETSTLTFDYLPAQSEHTGGLFFINDPRGRKIELRAQGYEHP